MNNIDKKNEILLRVTSLLRGLSSSNALMDTRNEKMC